MTEEDYIKATNRAKVTAALGILRDVLPGDDYGISQEEFTAFMAPLHEAEERLFKSYELINEDDGK